MLLVCFGLGSFFLATEATRLPSVLLPPTAPGNYALSILLSAFNVVLMVALTFALARRLNAIRFRSAAIIVIGTLLSVCLLLMRNQFILGDNALVQMLSSKCFTFFCVAFYFIWIKELYPKGLLFVATAVALSLLVQAACYMLVGLMRPEAALAITSIAPIISTACLCSLRSISRLQSERLTLHEDAPAASTQPEPAGPTFNQPEQSAFRLFVVFLVSMVCYAVIFGYVHRQWVVFNDVPSMTFIMQTGVSVGTACAAFFVLFFIRRAWSLFNLNLYMLLVVPLSLLTLWLTSIISESSIFLYLALLNFAHRSVLFFVAVIPLFMKTRLSIYVSWILGYLAYELGKVLSMSAGYFGGDFQEAASAVTAVILFLCGGMIAFNSLHRENTPANTTSDEPAKPDTRPQPGKRFQKACLMLAEQYGLTEREADTLLLLARGRTAGVIAETLYLSPSTVKVYTRNIYAKMGIHNQQDLISLVEEQLEKNKAAASAAQESSEVTD